MPLASYSNVKFWENTMQNICILRHKKSLNSAFYIPLIEFFKENTIYLSEFIHSGNRWDTSCKYVQNLLKADLFNPENCPLRLHIWNTTKVLLIAIKPAGSFHLFKTTRWLVLKKSEIYMWKCFNNFERTHAHHILSSS